MPKGKGYGHRGGKLSEDYKRDEANMVGRRLGGGGDTGDSFPTIKPKHDPKLHSPSGTGDFNKNDPRFPCGRTK